MRKRAVSLCSAAIVLAGCAASPVVPAGFSFPDFPENVAAMDLGQSLTIEVAAANAGRGDVTWTCAGEACTPLKTTPASVIFKASGVIGTAVITASSRKHAEVTRRITITVKLNESPDMLCK